VQQHRDVVVREVGPRDGLQSLSKAPAAPARVALVRALAHAGVTRIEAGAFVSPRAVPAMADSPAVFAACQDLAPARVEALVMNETGALRALEARADALVCVVSTSETFSQRNVRMSVDEALAVAGRIAVLGQEAGITVVADIATAFGCGYEGLVPDEAVVRVAAALADAGIEELTLADTTGMAFPQAVARTVAAVRGSVPSTTTLGLHFHNTRGLGLVNVQAGLEAGIRLFDASIGGLGGCPFSPGATGNVCTEDLVHLLHLLGLSTGIDLAALVRVAHDAEQSVGFELPGQLLRSGPVPDAVRYGALLDGAVA
jgi:hydroxymethylglutaryl-CoA lyase